MFDSQMALLSKFLTQCLLDAERDPTSAEPWAKARQAIGQAVAKEPDVVAAIETKDAPALRAIILQWESGKRLLPEQDRETLKRAIKAFRKSMKVTRLDAESSINANAMTSGRASSIVGIVPPPRYPREVWDELVRQGRLRGGRQGIYELPPDAE
ncbi:MAG: hypothetical protein SGI72_11270 [Planctomycetota bacterium]|nr:hypothetical protein [Planctomycetota bacterium]